MGAKRGIFVAPFDELFDPNVVARLAARAEEHGWDGFFVWDHIRYSPPASAVADPWVTLAAVAGATERLRLGPLVTPLSRRRVHKDPREPARMLDTGLRRLAAYWGGEFDPPPVQEPRIPVWVAGRWPARRPVRRAARWDGLFPIDLPGPEALAELISEVETLRREDGPFDFVA